MYLPYHEFTTVVPKSCIQEAIFITGYNLKLIYEYLKDKGCKTFPDETQQYGYVWIYDDKCKECISYTEEEFNKIFVRK